MSAKKIFFPALDVYIEKQMRCLNIPGASLAVVEGDQIVHLRGFGRARSGGGAPTPQTPFFIGSLAKSFTALAIMQLVEKGQIESSISPLRCGSCAAGEETPKAVQAVAFGRSTSCFRSSRTWSRRSRSFPCSAISAASLRSLCPTMSG
jgi:hypothetical protein